MKKFGILILLFTISVMAMGQRQVRRVNVSDTTELKDINILKSNDTITRVSYKLYDLTPQLITEETVGYEEVQNVLAVLEDEREELAVMKRAQWIRRDSLKRKGLPKKEEFVNKDSQIILRDNELKYWRSVKALFKR